MGFFQGYRSRYVHNAILLNADRADIWNEITNVMVHRFRFPWWLSLMGIPKPLSAQVIREGVGGYRVAHFSNNAEFRQEILEWDLHRKYRFHFNPTENFKVGHVMNLYQGPFEIETGGYDLMEVEGGVELILSSNYRLHGFVGWLMHLPFRVVVYAFQQHLLRGIRANLAAPSTASEKPGT